MIIFKAKKQISILEEELQGKEKELYDLKHELIQHRSNWKMQKSRGRNCKSS